MNAESERVGFGVAFASTLALILGLLSAVLTIIGMHFTVAISCTCVLVSALLALGLNFERLRSRQASPAALQAALAGGKRQIVCPCETEQSREASILARTCFGSETISPDKYEQFRLKNPNILACLKASDGRFLGYFDVIPLADTFGTIFIDGRVGEKDITHEYVLGPAQMPTARFIYFSGLAVRDASTMNGMMNASILVWASLKYLHHFYARNNAVLLASAATKEGEALLRHLGCELRCAANTRRDGHPLYHAALSQEGIVARFNCLPDFSPMVDLPWSSLKGEVSHSRLRPSEITHSRNLRSSVILPTRHGSRRRF